MGMSNAHLTDNDLLAATTPGHDAPYRFTVVYGWRLTQRTVTVQFAILNGRDRHLFAREYANRFIGANARILCVHRDDFTNDRENADTDPEK